MTINDRLDEMRLASGNKTAHDFDENGECRVCGAYANSLADGRAEDGTRYCDDRAPVARRLGA